MINVVNRSVPKLPDRLFNQSSDSSVSVQSTLKSCSKPLRANPFECYRDPATGRWMTIMATAERTTAELQGVKSVEPMYSVSRQLKPLSSLRHRLELQILKLRIDDLPTNRQVSYISQAVATVVIVTFCVMVR